MRHDRDAILARVDLEALADALLGERGHNRMWSCPNPAHSQTGRSPPLNVFVGEDGTQRWHCFGCGDGGTAIDLLLRTREAASEGEAFEWLARAANVAASGPTRRSARSAVRPARASSEWCSLDLESYVEFCHRWLYTSEARGPKIWLTERRAIPDEVIRAARVGFDPGPQRLARPDGIPRAAPAIVFPVLEKGRAVFTVSRRLGERRGQSRWQNTASWLARNPGVAFYEPVRRTRSGLVVTEGPIDALSATSAGYRAAALLGAGATSARVAQRLADTGERLVLAFDNDEAGQRGREQLSALLDDRGVRWTTLHVPQQHKDLNAWHAACRNNWRAVTGAGDRLRRSRWADRLPPVSVI
jgi:hypothetical protein